ncbi:MAG: hypothetical protein IKM25_04505 [Clostridia bacterium]|nr:hypothetical protein [Clostridia bacterium]
MSTKNIYTAVIVMLALVMVLVALMATGVIGGKEEETELQSYIATRVVQASETNEYGEITYYTMLEEYLELGVSSDHTYKPTTRPSTTENPFVEQDSFVYVTNEDGSPVYGEDGKPVTEVVKVTVDRNSITTQAPVPPETAYHQVTDANGKPVLDENGQPVTEAVTVETTTAPATTDRWSQSDEGFKGLRDDELANNIIDQINSDRKSVGGRAPLAVELNGIARSDSSFSAMKGFEDEVSGRGMTFVTTYGGGQLYADVARAMSSKIHSDSATKIGVGVFKANGKYYTTVIIE